MPKRLKKLSEEVLHENPWWIHKHDTYEKPDGIVGDYFYLETHGGAAAIVPVLPDGRIILILQYRYLMDKQSIEFPIGGIGKDCSPIEGAKRELLEETGYKATDWIKLGAFEPSNGLTKDMTHAFLAHVVEDRANQQLDETEDIEVLYRRPDEVEDMICRGDIWDGQTLAIWALVRHHLLNKHTNHT